MNTAGVHGARPVGCAEGGQRISTSSDSLTKTLVKTDFQKDWLFRLAIDGEPSEFDLFVKDISYGVFETATDEEQYGSASIAWPTANQTMKITMTVRDHIDAGVSRRSSKHGTARWFTLMGPSAFLMARTAM